MRQLLTFLTVFCGLGYLQAQSLPSHILSGSVLITAGSSRASGLIVVRSNVYALVTAKHVLFDSTNSDRLFAPTVSFRANLDARGVSNVLDVIVDLVAAGMVGDVRTNSISDVAVVFLGDIERLPTGASRIKSTRTFVTIAGEAFNPIDSGRPMLSGVESADGLNFDTTSIGADVILSGFPSSLGLKEIPQLDIRRPLFRRGMIASKDWIARRLIVDVGVFPGNSGGPVWVVEEFLQGPLTLGSGPALQIKKQYRWVGIITEFVPFDTEALNLRFGRSDRGIENSGYAVVEPIDPIVDLFTK